MPLEQLALLGRQGLDVGYEEAIVLGVEQDLAALTEVLGLALTPPHGELRRALVGADVEGQVAVLQCDAIDPLDPPQEVTPAQ